MGTGVPDRPECVRRLHPQDPVWRSEDRFRQPPFHRRQRDLRPHYFGDENPIGKTVSSATFPYTVTLVFADFPDNTHLKYDALFPLSLMEAFQPGYHSNNSKPNALWNIELFTYLMVPKGFDPREFRPISQKHFDTHMAELSKIIKTTFHALPAPPRRSAFRGETARRPADRQHLLCVWICGGGTFCPGDRLHQLHQPGHGTRLQAGAGSRHAQGTGRQPVALDWLRRFLAESLLLSQPCRHGAGGRASVALATAIHAPSRP